MSSKLSVTVSEALETELIAVPPAMVTVSPSVTVSVVPVSPVKSKVVDPPGEELVMVIEPPPLVIPIPVPAVNVAFANVFPVELPISNCPSV